MNKKFYLVKVYGSIDPSLRGPFVSVEEQEIVAKAMREELDDEDTLFWLDVAEDGTPEIGSFSGAFFEGEAADEERLSGMHEDWYVIAGPKDLPGVPTDQAVKVLVDYSAQEWDLFTETLDCGIAATMLNGAATIALNGDPAVAWDVFRAAQDKWSQYGAGDTEPSAAFAKLGAARFDDTVN